MNVLLLSMPDSFRHMPAVAFRIPNGALCSLAGNVDPHHRIAAADLILVQHSVRSVVERLVREHSPDLVGLSVMTFQRKTALRIIELIRALRPAVRVVVGGYDPSLAPEAYTAPALGIDFIVRGEGELTFRELLRAMERGAGFEQILGLSFRHADQFSHNLDRPTARLDNSEIRLPKRAARVLKGYTLVGRQVDVIETSRGCTFDCSFCSIIEMRGRNFKSFPFDRVMADIRDAIAHGARTVFIVDDNITLNVPRFESLCRAIIDARLNNVEYVVQAMTSAIANHGETLGPLMRRAGFRYVFLGIENVVERDLTFLKAGAKNRLRENGVSVGNATVKAIDYLHRNRMYVAGGLIIGNPDDTRESIQANFDFARRYVDYPYFQHPTPYPRTPMTKKLRDFGLIVTDSVEEYDGTTAVVRSEHLDAEEIELIRWRAERWLMVRHMPEVLLHSPLFCLRHAAEVLAHIYRGSTLKSFLGLEDERKTFARYRAIHKAEREYV